MKNEKGFTLVEIIMIMAILAVITMVAIPNYMNYQYRSNIKIDISTSAEIIKAARTYSMLNNNEPATIDMLIARGYLKDEDGNDISPLTSDDDENFELIYEDDKKYNVKFTTDESKVGVYGGVLYEVRENEPLPEVVKK